MTDHNFKTLSTIIICNSISNDFKTACLEWDYNGFVPGDGKLRYKCICTHDIIHNHVIINSFSNIELVVGSVCIKRFLANDTIKENAKIAINKHNRTCTNCKGVKLVKDKFCTNCSTCKCGFKKNLKRKKCKYCRNPFHISQLYQEKCKCGEETDGFSHCIGCNTIMSFGRRKGNTFSNVYERDKSYVKYIIGAEYNNDTYYYMLHRKQYEQQKVNIK
jgi:hypothetical protein